MPPVPPPLRPEPPPPLAEPASAGSPFDEPSDRGLAEPPPRPAPVAPTRGAGEENGLLAAFFKGARLNAAAPSDPAAMMTALGKAFRATVAGVRATLIARATIKSEFRIDQTMIQARGNNPLKFSADDD